MNSSRPIVKEKNEVTPSLQDRVAWLDMAKGIAIFIVVFAHVLGGIKNAHIELPQFFSAALNFYDQGIFVMPLFFFVSGFLAEHSLQKGLWIFIKKKVVRIAYPYFLWSIVQGSLQARFDQFTNSHVTVGELFQGLLFSPYAQFWFLYVLFIVFMYYGILRGIGLSFPGVLVVTGLGIFAVNVLQITIHQTVTVSLAYFLLGSALSFIKMPVSNSSFVLFSCIGFVFYGLFCHSNIQEVQFVACSLNCLGILATAALCIVLSKSQKFRWLQILGCASMPIYILHVITSASARIVLLYVFHTDNFTLLFALGMAAGLLLPILLYKGLRAHKCSQFFGL